MKRIVLIAATVLIASFAYAQASLLLKKTTGIPPADIYRAETASSVEKNWKFDRSLIRDQKPVAQVSFKVLPDGRVTDFEFKQPSWNKHFDAGVLNAVIKSIPFKPFPPGINEPWIDINIKFTPDGL